jgi:hypothetical protein
MIFGTAEIMQEMMPDSAAIAHAGTGNNDATALIQVNRLGILNV